VSARRRVGVSASQRNRYRRFDKSYGSYKSYRSPIGPIRPICLAVSPSRRYAVTPSRRHALRSFAVSPAQRSRRTQVFALPSSAARHQQLGNNRQIVASLLLADCISCRQMKKIEAVILPSRVDAVRTELRRRGICGDLTLTEVQHGDTHKTSITPMNGHDGRLKEGTKLELIVADRQVDKAVGVILRYALTGSHEPDGHVTLLDVSEVLKITHPAADLNIPAKVTPDGDPIG
jgi:nitrogen regulatory protein PII